MNCTNQLIENLKDVRCILFFKDNIWGADLTGILLISKHNKGIYLILLMNMYVFFIYKRKNLLQLLMFIKTF